MQPAWESDMLGAPCHCPASGSPNVPATLGVRPLKPCKDGRMLAAGKNHSEDGALHLSPHEIERLMELTLWLSYSLVDSGFPSPTNT